MTKKNRKKNTADEDNVFYNASPAVFSHPLANANAMCDGDPQKHALRLAAGRTYDALMHVYALSGTTVEEQFLEMLDEYARISSSSRTDRAVYALARRGVAVLPVGLIRAFLRRVVPNFEGKPLDHILEIHGKAVRDWLRGRRVSLKAAVMDIMCSAIPVALAARIIEDITRHVRGFATKRLVPIILRRPIIK